MRARRLLSAVVLLLAGWPAVARGQGEGTPSLRPRHVTLSGGVSWSRGYDIGDAAAELRGNAVGASAPPFTLFRSELAVEGVAGGEARVGYAVTRDLSVEVGFAYARPAVTAQISQDAETTVVTLDEAERLAQYAIEIGATWQVPRPVIGGRARPFVSGGAGYLRQLYDERTLVETGRMYYAGGGVRYWFRGGDGQRRSMGLRGEARATWRTDGVAFDDEARFAPSVTVHFFLEL